MPSPFPGMDPYLEHPRHWQDFHTEFLTTIRPRPYTAGRPKILRSA